MIIIPLQAIALYLISQYLHRSLSFASRTLYIILMLPGTIAHETCHALVALIMGARITEFSVIPSGDTLGHVEYTNPKIPVIGNTAISIAPLIGCPAILLFIGRYFGVHFDVFLYLALTLGAGAAPGKTNIFNIFEKKTYRNLSLEDLHVLRCVQLTTRHTLIFAPH